MQAPQRLPLKILTDLSRVRFVFVFPGTFASFETANPLVSVLVRTDMVVFCFVVLHGSAIFLASGQIRGVGITGTRTIFPTTGMFNTGRPICVQCDGVIICPLPRRWIPTDRCCSATVTWPELSVSMERQTD